MPFLFVVRSRQSVDIVFVFCNNGKILGDKSERGTNMNSNKIGLLTNGKAASSRKKRILSVALSVGALMAIVLLVALLPKKTSQQPVGTLKVYAYDISSGDCFDTMTIGELGDVVSSLGVWGPALNSVRGIPLTFQVEDPALNDQDILFHICVNGGEFLLEQEGTPPEIVKLGQDFTITNGETIQWRVSTKEWDSVIEREGKVFVDAIILAEGHIIGYAVVQIVAIPDSAFYAAVKVKTEYFSKENGGYQSVSEPDIRQRIEKCKNEIAQ